MDGAGGAAAPKNTGGRAERNGVILSGLSRHSHLSSHLPLGLDALS